MQFPSLPLLALMATLTYAQTIQQELAKIPACGMTCLATAASAAGCGAADFTCQCGPSREAITRSAIPCVVASCQGSDLATITQASTELCRLNALAGITGSGTSTNASPSATGTATVSASGTGTLTVASGSATPTGNAAVGRGGLMGDAAVGALVFGAGLVGVFGW